MTAPWTYERSRIAILSRAVKRGEIPADDPRLDEARRNLRAAKLAEEISAAVDAAPPLTERQRTELAELLRPAREHLTRQRLADAGVRDGGTA